MTTTPERTHDDILYSMFLEKIEQGVHYLNETYPGWVDDLNLGILDIVDPRLCVLGQVALANGETSFTAAVLKAIGGGQDVLSYFKAIDFAVEHGFVPVGFDSYEATQAWRHRITQLRRERILVA